MKKKVETIDAQDMGKILVFDYRLRFGKDTGKVVKQKGRIRGLDLSERGVAKVILEGSSRDIPGVLFTKRVVFKRGADVEIV